MIDLTKLWPTYLTTIFNEWSHQCFDPIDILSVSFERQSYFFAWTFLANYKRDDIFQTKYVNSCGTAKPLHRTDVQWGFPKTEHYFQFPLFQPTHLTSLEFYGFVYIVSSTVLAIDLQRLEGCIKKRGNQNKLEVEGNKPSFSACHFSYVQLRFMLQLSWNLGFVGCFNITNRLKLLSPNVLHV